MDMIYDAASGAKDRIGDRLYRSLCAISPLWLVKYRYRRATGRWYTPSNPRTFDEKLLWLMLYWHHPLKTRCADKLAVRSYVEENGLGHLLPGLLGVYESADAIDFDALPERFVLKATHGCGFNILCPDKRQLDVDAARRRLAGWLKTDISGLFGELHYASIPRRIICEAFLEDGSGERPSDFKTYCFNGRAHCTMVCTGRTEAGAYFNFYDRDWRDELFYCVTSVRGTRGVDRPNCLDDLIGAAETLSKPFPFARVDLYAIDGKPVFGEMTFTPHACIDMDLTNVAQEVMGDLLELPRAFPAR